jgi:hypothetical protein
MALQKSLSVPFSRIKYAKTNAGNRWKCGYIGDGVDSDWFSGKKNTPLRLECGKQREEEGGTPQ